MAQPTATSPRHTLPVRNLLAASAGNAVEWFDWTIFALFATFFAPQFFPADNPTLAYLYTALTFALAFFFRPLGGLVVGLLSDRRGRKPAMLFTVGLMCGGSLVIAATPTFATIGWAAPLLLLLARIGQGISTGGEVGNAYAYLYEIAPADRKGRYGSFVYVSSGSAVLLASLLGYWMTSAFSTEFMSSWGWRIPFVIGAALGVVVVWLRRGMDESGEFEQEVAGRAPIRMPLLVTLREHPKAVLQIIGFIAATTLIYYTLTNALKIYATTPTDNGGVIGATESDAFLALSIGIAVFIALQYPFGALADRIGRRNVALIGAGAFALLTIPLFLLISADLVNLIAVFAIGLGLCAMLTAVVPAVLSDLMPTRLRGVGIGSWYNLAVALFGGTAPLLVIALASAGNASWYFVYISVMSAIAALVLISVPDERKITRSTPAAFAPGVTSA